jgi:GNAT superfamily N-acetyltransferase
MQKVIVRKARSGDWKCVLKVQRKDGYNHSYYLDRSRIERLMKRGEIFFLAFSNDECIGFASVDLEIRATLHFMSVMESHHRTGVADKLLKSVIKETKKRNYRCMTIFIEKHSPTMELFLKEEGFEKVGHHDNRFGPDRDSTIWELKL